MLCLSDKSVPRRRSLLLAYVLSLWYGFCEVCSRHLQLIPAHLSLGALVANVCFHGWKTDFAGFTEVQSVGSSQVGLEPATLLSQPWKCCAGIEGTCSHQLVDILSCSRKPTNR